MSPVFGHGRLRLYLLNLLADSPKHGYELIQALSERFGGTYSPSAGTIYPRLAKLEEEGLVTKSADGRKTVYSITDEGRAELENRAGVLGDIEDELTDTVRRLADDVRAGVSEAMKSLRADLASAARDSRAGRTPQQTGADGSGSDAPTERAGTDAPVGTPSPDGSAATAADATAASAGSAHRDAVPEDARSTARLAARDAEVLLTAFRDELRSDLRAAAARGTLGEDSVTALRDALDAARAAVRATLR